MPVLAVPPDAERVAYIVRHMRVRDREEIYALRWDNDPEALVRDTLLACGPMSWCWELDGLPVSLQGSCPIRPGVWANWSFGTDRWSSVLLSMTRHARHFIQPALERAGYHRAQALTLASHSDARGWIEALGGQLEGIQAGVGRSGEDFACYVWMPSGVQRPQV